ncbi:MAG: PASTA domain-containing protein [Nannocystaceae bacterium]
MSRTSSLPRTRVFQALGLVVSASALAGLVYVQTVSASPKQAEPDQLAAELELDEDDELDELDELDDADALPSSATTTIAIADTAVPAPIAAPAPAPTPETITAAQTNPEPVLVAALAVDTQAEAIDPPAPALVMVPDISGMRLDRARRELKAVGLRLVARDTWGDRIERSWYRDYKVRTQKVAAGTEVEPGSRVRVKARERYVASQGY